MITPALSLDIPYGTPLLEFAMSLSTGPWFAASNELRSHGTLRTVAQRCAEPVVMKPAFVETERDKN